MNQRVIAVITLLVIAFLPASCGHWSESNSDCDDSDTDSDTDSDADTDSGSDAVSVSNLSWSLHDEIESLVYVSWDQGSDGEVFVEYRIDDQWHRSPDFFGNKGTQERLIAGIPYATDSNWRIVHSGKRTGGPTITTGTVPTDFPIGTVTVSDENGWYEKGNYLLLSSNQNEGGWIEGTYWTFIIDRKARPVWARMTPIPNWTLFAQVSASGDYILWDENTYWSIFDNGAESKVHFTYLDEEFDVVATPGLHHPFVQLPDGTLAWGSLYHKKGEVLAEKAPGANEETILWEAASDWPGAGDEKSNGLFYAEDTNSYLFSFYTNSSIVEVDRSKGTSLWWAGIVEGGYSFDPPESQFDWQHSPSYTDTGTLLVSLEANNSTPVYEYQVDHKTETLTLVWSYDPGVIAHTNGDVTRLENGNTLHLVGTASHIIEVDPDGEVVWRVVYGHNRLLGHGVFIEDLYDLVSPQ